MLFPSTVFLFLFFPAILIGNFLLQERYRNTFLLIMSLVFYAWGEPKYLILILISIGINYGLGYCIEKQMTHKKFIFIISILFNLGLIGFFKYFNFLLQILNSIGLPIGQSVNIPLPIGISFYTFQIISYLIDVYRGKIKAQKNIINLGLYISLFPQLIAGPIVRYETIEKEIQNRQSTLEEGYEGFRRFFMGLAKKVLIANNMAMIADNIFALSQANLSFGLAWIGIICYTLQIYYDFSGYSDMAIGIGRILGFHFLENFNYPYISKSIQEFWRRWHISLSSWFRDYLYIPLGGNRKGKNRTYLNLLIVFALCGLWHGASFNFVIWGLFHGFFLVLERQPFFQRLLEHMPKLVQHCYTLVIVMVGWVFFRADTLHDALFYLKAMFGMNGFISSYYVFEFFLHETWVAFFAAIVLCCPIFKLLENRWNKIKANDITGGGYIVDTLILVVGFLSILSVANGTYNPFIYFRF